MEIVIQLVFWTRFGLNTSTEYIDIGFESHRTTSVCYYSVLFLDLNTFCEADLESNSTRSMTTSLSGVRLLCGFLMVFDSRMSALPVYMQLEAAKIRLHQLR